MTVLSVRPSPVSALLVPSAPKVLGSITPRIWTPPLRELTPETSIGFDQVEFARTTLRHPADPWQEWLFVHAGELLPDGRPRFRVVIVLVARQNGKTEALVILSLYWQFVDAQPLILGTSTKLDYAKESWLKATKLIEKRIKDDDDDALALRALVDPKGWKRAANGEQESWTTEDSRYKIAASNEEGGRSLTINRLVCDELRQHRTYAAWGAAEPAASPWDAQIWALSNAGDDRSVVLNDLRDDAVAYIRTGIGDPRIGLFEWSCDEDADPGDVHALAQANPNLGRRHDGDVLVAKGGAAKRKGGEALTMFRTEVMCIRVKNLNPAIDPTRWNECHERGDLAAVRSRVALVLDVAPDGEHATLAAAAMLDDGRVRAEVVEAWEGPGCTDRAVKALDALVTRIKPQTFGWLPNGPAASLTAKLRRRPGWPPPGVVVQEIKSDLPAVCMGLEDLVVTGQFVHSDDPLLNAQQGSAERRHTGDTWVFSRRGDGHVDAVYAVAGAVHLARTMPAPVGRPRVLFVDD